MRFACDSCGAQYMIADEKVGTRGVKVKCKKCSHMIVVKPQAEAAPAAPAPAPIEESAPGGAGAAGLGGAFNSVFGQQSFNEATSTMPSDQLAALQQEAAAQTAAAAAARASEEAAQDSGLSSASSGYGGEQPSGFPSSDSAPADTSSTAAFGFGDPSAVRQPPAGGETDFALNSLDRPKTPSGRAAGEKEWYVAIEDSQVGPIDMAELEERWDKREIDEDALVWKAGMGDWIPLAEAPELAYLVTERPQASAARLPAAGRSDTFDGASGGAAAAGSMAPASFSAGAPQDLAEEPSWRPSAATALSSLVQEELVAKKPEPDAPRPSAVPAGMEGLGISGFGAGDLFGNAGAGGGGNGAALPSMGAAAPAADPFAGGGGGSPAWSMPAARQSHGGAGLKIVVASLVVVVLGMGMALAYFLVLKPQMQPQVQYVPVQSAPQAAVPAQPAPAPVAVAQAPSGAAAGAVAPGEPAPAGAAAAVPTPSVAEKPSAERDDRAGRGTKASRTGRDKPATAEKVDKPAGGKTKPDKVDDVFKEDLPAPTKAALTKDDIIDGVRSNGPKLKPCLEAARSKGEVAPQKYAFVLDWTIAPNGSVSGARLKGPADVMGTSLPACFGRVVNTWKFPASQKATPIANFPLPISVR